MGNYIILFLFGLSIGVHIAPTHGQSNQNTATNRATNRATNLWPWPCCGPSCTKRVFLSVVTNIEVPECSLLVRDVPLYSNLYEAMLFAEQQYPPTKFRFTVNFDDKYGHFINSIDGVESNNPFFWCVYDDQGVPLPVGTDFTYPSNNDAYIWNYENTTETHCSRYRGPCLRSESSSAEDNSED